MSLLINLISKEYTVVGNGRWYHTSEHDSLVIDVEKDVFYWNSKGIAGDAYVWLTKILEYSHEDAKNKIKEERLYGVDFIHTIESNTGEEIVVYPRLVDIFYENGIKNSSYWSIRGISKETISRFRLGYSEGWFTIPIYQDGLFRNFQCRRDEPMKAMKAWYKHTHPYLFNSDILRVTNTIMVSEGLTDCLLLNQLGIPAVSHTGGANYWNESWFKYFIHQRQVYIVYDNDSAGRLGSRKVASSLGVYKSKVFTFEGEKGGYDVGKFFLDHKDMDKSGIATLLYDRIKSESKHSFEL